MMLRVITRTHYQVDEPAYLRVLVNDCSSPIRSEYSERIAARLEERLKVLRKDFNLTAANYCVDLAKGLNLLTENNFWTSLGHVFNLIASGKDEVSLTLDLSAEEKVFCFRAFLEKDGAALIFLARKALSAEQISQDWNAVANEMMNFIYTSYLELVTDIRDRSEIRQLLAKRKRQPYSGKSGPHQCFVHLQTMTRIGMLQANGRQYFKPLDDRAVVRFLEIVPNIKVLESVISKKEWPKLAFAVFNADAPKKNIWSDSEILRISRELYARVMATGVAKCPLDTLIETIQIKQIATSVPPTSHDGCMTILRRAQTETPNKIKFHVDRMGRPAFIVFS